jgi:hypothetical protein
MLVKQLETSTIPVHSQRSVLPHFALLELLMRVDDLWPSAKPILEPAGEEQNIALPTKTRWKSEAHVQRQKCRL